MKFLFFCHQFSSKVCTAVRHNPQPGGRSAAEAELLRQRFGLAPPPSKEDRARDAAATSRRNATMDTALVIKEFTQEQQAEIAKGIAEGFKRQEGPY